MTVVRNPGLAVGTAWTAAAVDGGAGEPVPSPEVLDGRFLAELPVGGPAGDGARLGELGGAGVVAVPDHWLHAGARGALERERLAGLLGSPLFVGHGEAAVAGGEGPALVCEVGPEAVCATLCLAEGGEVGVLDSECAHVDGYERRLAGGERFVPALRRQLLERPERAELVLVRARTLDRYRATPVYEPGLTAGQVLDCFEPVATALRDTVATLLARRPERELDVVVCGLGVPPLTRAAVLEGVAAAGARACGVREAGAATVAQGAALIAAGAVRVRGPEGIRVRLPARRIVGGRLRSWDIPLPAGGQGVEVVSDGRALEVESASGTPLPVQGPPMPAGRVIVTYWPNRRDGGVVVVRQDEDGPALAYVVEEQRGHG
ncbi:hypothetical protein [Nonomuraea insulae]|uniref:Uncharacterized protein n=1 Tax=Nonomuraea insulae TaxID=1616787 RepID=A0ABW1CBR7_9ACTN